MPEHGGLIARLTSYFRWLLFAVLVCAAGLVVFRQLVLDQLDEQIRGRVESMLAGHYRDMDVQIRAARRIEGQGIEIRGLLIRSLHEATAYRDLVYIDEMILSCQADLGDLLCGRPNVNQLTVRRMKLRATCYQKGEWNIAHLLPLPNFGGSIPEINIEDSTVELQDLCRKATSEKIWAIRNVNLQAASRLSAAGQQQWEFNGKLLGDHFKNVKLQGLVDAEEGRWSAWGTMDGLEMSQRLLDAAPNDVARYLSPLATLRARAHFTFQLGHDPDDTELVRVRINGHVAEGRVQDPRLPLPLSDLEADVYCDNRQIRIENVTARSGPTSLGMTCRCDDYLSDSPQLHLQASVRQLLLDKQLSNALPDQMRDDWESLGPAGVVDLDVQLTMLNNRFVPDVNITCRDVSFVAPKFPIRLRQGNGRLRLVDDTLTIEEFSVLAADQRLHAQGEFHNPGPRGTGWLELNSEGPITLDHELISAMSEAGRRVVMSLQPAGGITLTRGRYEKSHPDQNGSSRWDLSLVDCSVQYERFPYAIHNVSGKLVLEDRRWDFQELRGEHGSSQIYCNGSWVPLFADQPGGNLTLNFTCRDVPLNDSLRNAVGKLNPGAEQFWNGISPRGTVDELGMTFQFNSVTHQSHLNLVAQKQPAQQNLQGRGITVRPSWFPLELQDCTGRIRYQDGRFQLENIAARHGHSRIELTGNGNLTKDHRWEVGLSQLIADTLPVDRDLLDALPAAMRAPIRQLKYQGVISLNGNAWMRGAPGVPLSAGWDVLLDIDDGAVENELKLQHIFGGIRLTGSTQGQAFQSRGMLDVDSVMARDIQITQLHGPFWMDSQQLILGSRASVVKAGQPPQQITAHALGGNVALDAHVVLDDQLNFAADVSLADAAITDFARSLHSARHDISGKVYAVLRFKGAKAGLHTLQGTGQVRLREANIYELPVMARLLKFLSLRPPDDTGFTSSDIDFRLQGEQLYFDRVDFHGDAISLKGKGWMDLNRQVNLDFYALVGRPEFQLPVIHSLLAEASKNILLIQVVGDIDNPQVIKKPLPELDDTLQRLFPESAPRTAER